MFVKNTNLNYKSEHFEEFYQISLISEEYQSKQKENVDPHVYL